MSKENYSDLEIVRDMSNSQKIQLAAVALSGVRVASFIETCTDGVKDDLERIDNYMGTMARLLKG